MSIIPGFISKIKGKNQNFITLFIKMTVYPFIRFNTTPLFETKKGGEVFFNKQNDHLVSDDDTDEKIEFDGKLKFPVRVRLNKTAQISLKLFANEENSPAYLLESEENSSDSYSDEWETDENSDHFEVQLIAAGFKVRNQKVYKFNLNVAEMICDWKCSFPLLGKHSFMVVLSHAQGNKKIKLGEIEDRITISEK